MAGAFGAWANRLISGLLATVLYPGWGELVRTMAQSIDATAARIP